MAMYNDNNGDSLENAVVIHGTSNTKKGIEAENQYLSEKFGQHGLDWNKIGQSLIEIENKQYDRIDIELMDGTSKKVYFDISEFYGVDSNKVFKEYYGIDLD